MPNFDPERRQSFITFLFRIQMLYFQKWQIFALKSWKLLYQNFVISKIIAIFQIILFFLVNQTQEVFNKR